MWQQCSILLLQFYIFKIKKDAIITVGDKLHPLRHNAISVMDDVVHPLQENRAGRSLRHSTDWHGKGGMFQPQNWEHYLGNKNALL